MQNHPISILLSIIKKTCHDSALCAATPRDQIKEGDNDGSIYSLEYIPNLDDPTDPQRTIAYYVNMESKTSPSDCHAIIAPGKPNDIMCEEFDFFVGYDISFTGDCFNQNVGFNHHVANGNPYQCTITLNDKPVDKITDSDADGIANYFERKGLDINNDRIIDLNLPQLGANPNHKDLFIEIDYMDLHKPIQRAIDNVKSSFANAPLTNPDGANGINLHVIVDDQIPHVNEMDLDDLPSIEQR